MRFSKFPKSSTRIRQPYYLDHLGADYPIFTFISGGGENIKLSWKFLKDGKKEGKPLILRISWAQRLGEEI